MSVSIRMPRWLLCGLAGLLLAGGVGFAAYTLGRDSVDTDAVEQDGYDEGHDAGFAEGEDAGFAQGEDAGEAAGLKRGKKIGRRQARPLFTYDEGYTDGANDAMSSDSFEWSASQQFIVTVVPGEDFDWEIDSQLVMDPRETYYVCRDDPLGTCGR